MGPERQRESDLGITLKHLEESTAICLEEGIDIASAAELKTTLLDAFKPGKAVHVSFAENAELDITALQLLWAAEREARVSSIGFNLTGAVPDKILSTLKDAGIEKFPFLT